ncbi:MAG: DUF305 domain-containing protein [Candidatus Pacebacteria bacterium]|nr:DUF305 domain-containing protein [Candidatus Paceibacterota bacterium]
MKTNTGLLIVLLVVVSAGMGYLVGSSTPRTTVHKMSDGREMTDTSMSMHDEMAGMMSSLSGKEGDELDKAFLAEMIVHHEGAVDMAKAVLAKGKHPELQKMATDIIEAQTKEIAQMKEWQTAWYKQ